MSGFDPEWKDLPHYIIGITKRLWEDRDVAAMPRYYSDDIVVRMAGGIHHGHVGTVKSVLATLQEFPDRENLAQDIIWSGSPEEGMLSSHRVLSLATHRGGGPLGEGTNKRVRFRCVADCWVKDNVIQDEWLVRDGGAVARQLGLTPRDMARAQIDAEGGLERAKPAFSPDIDEPGPYMGRGNDNPWGEKHADLLTCIMNADLKVISQTYDRAVAAEIPGGDVIEGHAAMDHFWIGLRSAMPNAEFAVHHRIGRDEDPMMPPRSAIRWSLWGNHEGWGAFGAPSGAKVYVMGMSHAEWGPWGLRREWINFDEVAVFKQILMSTG